jgi:hypothetical protein
MIRRRFSRGLILLGVGLGLTSVPARSDAPVAAAAAVHRLMAALRANDRAAFLDAVADSYDYDGLKKEDLSPFGDLSILYDRLLYRIAHLLQVEPGVATAIVDGQYTGRLNLEALELGQPVVTGSSRLWIEVRRQRAPLSGSGRGEGEGWRVTAIRPIRVQFVHGDTPMTFLERVTVNGLSSVRARQGSTLMVEGVSSISLGQLVRIGALSATQRVDLNLQLYEPWALDVQVPSEPGRYYLDAVSLILAPRESGGVYLAWDEMSVPVLVTDGAARAPE